MYIHINKLLDMNVTQTICHWCGIVGSTPAYDTSGWWFDFKTLIKRK